jgi:hypothetical protein
VTQGAARIGRMTAYFKVRSDGKVLLQWCSSLRLSDGSDDDAGATDSDGNAPLTSRAFSPVLSVPLANDASAPAQRERPYVCPVSNTLIRTSDAGSFVPPPPPSLLLPPPVSLLCTHSLPP